MAEDELLDAMRSRDLISLERLIADDLTFIDPSGAVLTKADDLEAHRTGATRFARIDEVERRTQEVGGQGTTVTTAAVVLRDDSGDIPVRLRWRREWRIIDGRWQVFAGSVSVLDAD